MVEEKAISDIYSDICNLVENARSQVASTTNKTLTLLYWQIGNRINSDVLVHQRAAYGKQIVSQLAAKLSWSHFLEFIPSRESLQREFYLTMALIENWGRDTLRSKIDSMLYERSLISGKTEQIVKSELDNARMGEAISPDLVFKNPYFLDFTGLKGYYSEKSLEDSLLVSMEQFIMELGVGFTFVERQKRLIIDNEDFYIDLLFYHRKLRRLIAVELKLGKFKAAYKGQMELYLNWLDKNEKQTGEETPLGLILCAEGGHDQIELLKLEQSGIKVAEYLTELPDKKLLQEKLRKEINLNRQLFNQEENETNK